MLDLEPIKEFSAYNGKSIIIAGPCSAETEQQTMETALALKKIGIHIFRAGIWKPRTKPGGFEGIGFQGLSWLTSVKQETGMAVTTEVANPNHVEAALKAGVDILWIGARTAANPFTVQEIAESLKGTDTPIMVKNPINPDLELWIGALERLNKAGIKKLAVIHRGFSSYAESIYRNPPQWQIPIELRRRIPELPIICDPSHMGGRRDLILSLSQTALNMQANGLIIEVHPNPDIALSDANQQITPEQLKDILQHLIELKSPDINDTIGLNSYRSGLDKCDQKLLDILNERFQIAAQIGFYKKSHNLTILQSDRYNEVTERLMDQAEKLGISSECIQNIFESIHSESIRQQLNAISDNKSNKTEK
jgi:chorismate mutase